MYSIKNSLFKKPVRHILKKFNNKLEMMAHTFNPSTQEVETRGFLWFWGQSGLYNKFQGSYDYINSPCLKQTNKHSIYKKMWNGVLDKWKSKTSKCNIIWQDRLLDNNWRDNKYLLIMIIFKSIFIQSWSFCFIKWLASDQCIGVFQ